MYLEIHYKTTERRVTRMIMLIPYLTKHTLLRGFRSKVQQYRRVLYFIRKHLHTPSLILSYRDSSWKPLILINEDFRNYNFSHNDSVRRWLKLFVKCVIDIVEWIQKNYVVPFLSFDVSLFVHVVTGVRFCSLLTFFYKNI